jgi:hypothetical protein
LSEAFAGHVVSFDALVTLGLPLPKLEHAFFGVAKSEIVSKNVHKNRLRNRHYSFFVVVASYAQSCKATTGQPESARRGFLLYVGSYILAIKLG